MVGIPVGTGTGNRDGEYDGVIVGDPDGSTAGINVGAYDSSPKARPNATARSQCLIVIDPGSNFYSRLLFSPPPTSA